MSRTPDIHICETGLRDGLQLVRNVVPTPVKAALIDALAASGITEIDVTSFVPTQVLPQFADAAEVAAHALKHPGWQVAALAPNLKGAERAIASGVHILNFVVSVSRSHNEANVRRSPEEQVEVARDIKALISSQPCESRPRLVVALATAFGCSIEGRIKRRDVYQLATQMREAGADEIVLADTVGYADPLLIRNTVNDVRHAVGEEFPIRLHLHDTMGTGMANVLAGIEIGVKRFDAAFGGLGGCPFAPGASGNIATEDLVFMAEQMGLRTGIDLKKLIKATNSLAHHLPQERMRSHVREAGIPRVYRTAA